MRGFMAYQPDLSQTNFNHNPEQGEQWRTIFMGSAAIRSAGGGAAYEDLLLS